MCDNIFSVVEGIVTAGVSGLCMDAVWCLWGNDMWILWGTNRAMVGVMSGVSLLDRWAVEDLMRMFCLIDAVDQLAMASSMYVGVEMW